MIEYSKWLHHLHIRKRIHQQSEKYPHPNKFKNFIDKLIYIVGFIWPIMTVPQLATIWIDQNSSGVSLISWTTYLLTSTVWVIYWILHRDRVIIITFSIWIIMDILIVVWILMNN